MSVRILATADLHIGRTSTQTTSRDEWGSTKQAWLDLVDMAIEQEIDLILIAGDLVEHDNRYYEASAALKKGFERLNEAGIQVVLTAGNHDFDVLPQLIDQTGGTNIHLLGREGIWSEKTITIRDMEIQFTGWSFPSRIYTEDPLKSFPQHRIQRDIPVFGLLHGDCSAFAPESRYAPFSLPDLEHLPVDYWLLGHIHKPMILREASPRIVYPGSLQALNPKETREHGYEMLEIDNNGIHPKKTAPFSSIRYENIEIDITDLDATSHIREKITNAMDALFAEQVEIYDRLKEVVIDVQLTGYHADLEELDQFLKRESFTGIEREVMGYIVTLRRVYNMCELRVDRLQDLASEPGPAGLLAAAILDLQSGRDTPFIQNMRREMDTAADLMRTANAYRYLFRNREEEGEAESEQTKKDRITERLIRECHRTLSEMMKTKHQTSS